MMGRKQKLKSGEEYDLLYAKKYYCYLKNSGVSKKIKQILNKRFRKSLKEELRRTLKED